MPENTPTSPDPQFRPERSSDRGRVRALSPSRIKDYIQCPRLFFYKSILGIPTPPSMATLRGTLAHHAFERVFDHPVGSRSVDVALSYVEPAWRMTLDPLVDRATVEPGSAEDVLRRLEGRYRDEHEPGSESESRLLEAAVQARMVVAGHDEEAFINTVRDAVANWYVMENPDKFTPTERERYVRAQVGKVTVHGYIDRLDVIASSSGVERTYVSDYKGLALDTPLPTPSGWTTMGRVRPGDELLGVRGPVTVCEVTPEQTLPCYRLVFADGSSLVADQVHLWPVVVDGVPVVMSTAELAELAMPVSTMGVAPLELVSRPAPLDPFDAGRRLAGPEMVSPLSQEYQTLVVVSRGAGVDRRALVEGLRSTSTDPGFLQVRDQAVAELVEEVLLVDGYLPVRWVRDAGVSSRPLPVDWEGEVASPRAPSRSTSRATSRTIVEVRPVEPVVTRCVAVDAVDHLYLAGRSMVPTHNTGKKPSPRFVDEAFFQLEVYALLLREADGTRTDQLRLIYVKERDPQGVLSRPVTDAMLGTVREKILAVAAGIDRSSKSGQWPTRKQPLCDWCHFKPVCPAWHPELEGLLPEEVELRLTRPVEQFDVAVTPRPGRASP